MILRYTHQVSNYTSGMCYNEKSGFSENFTYNCTNCVFTHGHSVGDCSQPKDGVYSYVVSTNYKYADCTSPITEYDSGTWPANQCVRMQNESVTYYVWFQCWDNDEASPPITQRFVEVVLVARNEHVESGVPVNQALRASRRLRLPIPTIVLQAVTSEFGIMLSVTACEHGR